MQKSPGRRRRGTGPGTSQNTTSKCPGLLSRVGAKDFLVSESTNGLMLDIFPLPSLLQDEGRGGQGRGENLGRGGHVSAGLLVEEEAGILPGHQGRGS